MNVRKEPISVTPAPSGQNALRGAVLVGLLLAARIIVVHHPIPAHGDEVEFLAGIGFPAPYPVHHPGYPLWIALGTAASKTGLSSYAAYEFWSVLGSLLAPWLLYRGLGRVVWDGLAWWTALAFGLNPLVWFLAATALNYTCALALGLLIVGLCWRAMYEDDSRAARRSALAMSLCLWLRPDYLAWLGPMLLVAIWRHRRRGGLWGVPLVALSLTAFIALIYFLYGRGAVQRPPVGQFSHWLEALINTSAFKLGIVDGLLRGCTKYFGILTWVFGASTLLLPFAAFALFRKNAVGWVINPPFFGGPRNREDAAGQAEQRDLPQGPSSHGVQPPSPVVVVPRYASTPKPIKTHRSPLAFLLLWITPLTAFVLLIHMSEPGHIILLIPAAYMLICLWLHARFNPRTALRIASAMALASAAQFLAYPWSTQSTGWQKILNAKIAYLSAFGLRQIDHRWDIHTPSDIWPTAKHHPTATRPSFAD